MSRDPTDFLQDIQDSCQRVVEYTTGLSRDEVFSDKMRVDGILFNFQIIGEAVKNLPAHRVSLRGRRGAVPGWVFDPRGAAAYLTVRRAP